MRNPRAAAGTNGLGARQGGSSMTANRLAILALALVLGLTPYARALVLGGGKAKADCYAAWEGVTTNLETPRVGCQDGDECDEDGGADGACTFMVSVCVDQTDPSGRCTAQPV